MKMNQKSQSKVIVAMASVILLLAVLSISLTFAYFSDTDTTESNQTITFDTLTVDITEGAWAMATEDGHTLTKALPGCEVDMAGSVALAGADAYVKVVFAVEAAGVQDEAAVTAIKTALGSALGAGWAQDTAGNWVTTDAVSAGTIIDFSGKSVTLPTTLGNEYQGQSITIGYTVKAIQADHQTLDGVEAISAACDNAVNVA